MIPQLLLNLTIFVLLGIWLGRRLAHGAQLGRTILLALVLGALAGAGLQKVYGFGGEVVQDTIAWIGLVGGGYVRLLQMIVMPLILVSILGSIVRLDDARALGRMGAGVLAVLLLTTAGAALIGAGVTRLFGLSVDGLVQGARELERGMALTARTGEVAQLGVRQLLLSFIPTNPFAELTGPHPTSIISVVLFASLLGVAGLQLRRESPEVGSRIVAGIDTIQRLVMRLVRMVIRLTPYGVLALTIKMVAGSSLQDILNLAGFVAASYVGLALILLMHAGLLAGAGVSPRRFFTQAWPVLTFAFTSRSSAATVPLNVEAQVARLGVPPSIANFAAGFGATIGQNGCAGLYPAMLAVMIAPSAGIDPTRPGFLATLVLVVTLGSFGIAGVGGGATIAAILVLSTLNLPVALAGLLISVEPLIDMGRTAINVSGAMTAGVVTARVLHAVEAPVRLDGEACPM